MIDKARRLVESGRVERLNHERFNVVGDHGTYTVVQTYEGRVTCNCPGFVRKGRCSHATAVIILTKISKRGDRAKI
jgi:hypothetical protein